VIPLVCHSKNEKTAHFVRFPPLRVPYFIIAVGQAKSVRKKRGLDLYGPVPFSLVRLEILTYKSPVQLGDGACSHDHGTSHLVNGTRSG